MWYGPYVSDSMSEKTTAQLTRSEKVQQDWNELIGRCSTGRATLFMAAEPVGS
jgi:hypothetical protein